MAAIQGNTVWNNQGSSWEFSSRDDAWQAYGLICGYEAYTSDLIRAGIITVKYGEAIHTEIEHHPYPIRPDGTCTHACCDPGRCDYRNSVEPELGRHQGS